MRAVVRLEHVRDATARAGLERLAVRAGTRALRCAPLRPGRAARGARRARRARLELARRRGRRGRARARRRRRARLRVARRAEQEERARGGGRAGLRRRRGRGSARVELERGVERELEVGRVLLRGVALDAASRCLRAATPAGEPSRSRRPRRRPRARARARARARCRPRPRRRRREQAPLERRAAPRRLRPPLRPRSDTPSSAGITQIRFCGSAARSSRPLSPVARAPRTLP